jgi:hypothetical protein
MTDLRIATADEEMSLSKTEYSIDLLAREVTFISE